MGVPLGADDGRQHAIDAASAAPAPSTTVTAANSGNSAGATIEIASFHVGHSLLGVPASAVVEAIPFGGTVRLPNAPEMLRGATIYRGATMLLYDLHKALGLSAPGARDHMLTVVLRGDSGRQFGVLVDRLADVPVVKVADIAPVGSVFGAVTPILASVVTTLSGPGGAMLTLLAVDKLEALLNQA